jgi:glycosyltransferase involved in cell wall biosynthesis
LKLLFVINDLGFFVSHRLPVAQAAQECGYEVHVAYGMPAGASQGSINNLGLKLHFVPIRRGGTNPLVDFRSVIMLSALFLRIRPDIVHLVTIKPVLYGGIAARIVRVPALVSAMAGLGFVFVRRPGLKAAFIRYVVSSIFRLVFVHKNQKLIFQNASDRDRILSITPVPARDIKLIRGSGIELTACPVLPESMGVPIVVMASRLLSDKGVFEFIQAARILRSRGTQANFWLIGEPDSSNPASVKTAEILSWQSERIVEFFGHRGDVLSLYSKAHIVTLPSYYGEGLPKALIEAAACGRAVITTDMPGCRDAIEPGVTGLLVPPRDPLALADAVECLIKDSSLRQSMGKAGRALAEREFCIEKVVAAHLQIYEELLEKCESR